MKSFKTIVVVKRPCDLLWSAMRDHLADFANTIDDIDRIEQRSRHFDANGRVEIVNAWHLCYQIPAFLRSLIKPEQLGWIDRNLWDQAASICFWRIEPFFLTEYIDCFGQTNFQPAIAGQGTRITFEGTFVLKPGALGAQLASLEKPISGFVETLVTTVVPRNLRGVVAAADAYAAFKPD